MIVDDVYFEPIEDAEGNVVKSMDMAIYGAKLLPTAAHPNSIPVHVIMRPFIKDSDYLVVAVVGDKRVGIPVIPEVLRKKRKMALKSAEKIVKDELKTLYPDAELETYYMHYTDLEG